MVAVWSFEGTERTAMPIQPVLDRPFDKLPISLSLSRGIRRLECPRLTLPAFDRFLCAPGLDDRKCEIFQDRFSIDQTEPRFSTGKERGRIFPSDEN